MPIKRETFESLALFSRELIARRSAVGAVVPSGRALAQKLAAHVPAKPEGYIVELGAGTGPVTSAILNRGVPHDRLIPVELSLHLARHLRSKFPGLNVVHGDASNLRSLLEAHVPQARNRVTHVVSSLPLRSLPRPVVEGILDEVHRLLGPGGSFIQFTYSLTCSRYEPLSSFERHSTSIAWLNVPPARVDLFRPRLKHSGCEPGVEG